MNILSKIAQWIFSKQHGIITDQQVKKFFENITSSYSLTIKLSNLQYVWKGELYYLDWDKSINECLSYNKINCNDFTTIYTHFFMNVSRCCNALYYISMEDWCLQTLLSNWSPRWHSITVFCEDNCWYYQSNMTVHNLGSITEEEAMNKVLEHYQVEGYKDFKIDNLINYRSVV